MSLKPAIATIDAWDDAASQLRFLEDTLYGKDWRVSIVYPDASPGTLSKLEGAKAVFEKRGYLVREGSSNDNQPTLELHHLGEHTKLADVYHDLGFVKGTARLITQPSLGVNRAFHGIHNIANWLDGAIHNPARADGVINTVSEGLMFMDGGLKNLNNRLYTTAISLFAAQSFIYAFIAKSNDDIAIDHLKAKFNRASNAGEDIAHIHYEIDQDKDKQTFFHSLWKFVARYPIQIGAALNDMGMLLFIGHAFAERSSKIALLKKDALSPALAPKELQNIQRYIKNGYLVDIAGAVTSIVAWGLMLLPRKHRDEETIKNHQGNLFATSWDKFRQDPEVVSGLMTAGASSLRGKAALMKGNYWHASGEGVYILGDIAMMFTKNDEYGGERTKDIDALAEKIATYVNSQPVVFGPQSQQQFVDNITKYLKEKSLEEVNGDPGKLHLTMAQVDERAAHLCKAVMKKIGARDHFDRLADKTMELILRFSPEQQPAIKSALVTTLAQLPWIKATEAELKTALDTSPFANRPRDAAAVTPRQMHDVSRQVAELLQAVPDIDMGGGAAAIQHALLPFMQDRQSKMHLSPASIMAAQPSTMIRTPANGMPMDHQAPQKSPVELAELAR